MNGTHFTALVWRLISLIFCLFPISVIGTSAVIYSSIGPAIAQSQTAADTEIANRLVGQWRLRDYLPIPLTVVFTAEGKSYVLLPFYLSFVMSAFGGNSSGPTGGPVAYEFRYQVNPKTQPMQIDLAAPSENKAMMTIFEFTPDGQLRVEWEGLNPGDPRPTEFTVGAIFLQKVSNTTALPRNTQILDLAAEQKEAERRGKESEGKEAINSLSVAQQAFYLENDKFATAISDLGVEIEPESENYRYQIVPQNTKVPSATITAQAKKPELRSYTGAVFVIKIDGETKFLTGICETIEPSTKLPGVPIPPTNSQADETFQCPAGSRRVE